MIKNKNLLSSQRSQDDIKYAKSLGNTAVSNQNKIVRLQTMKTCSYNNPFFRFTSLFLTFREYAYE